jgi:hypothetical protein
MAVNYRSICFITYNIGPRFHRESKIGFETFVKFKISKLLITQKPLKLEKRYSLARMMKGLCFLPCAQCD